MSPLLCRFSPGTHTQECRLIKENPASLRWKPGDCARCSVPDIRHANASPDLELRLTVVPTLLGLSRRLVVEARCKKHHVPVEDAYVGCPQCNAERPGLDAFIRALEDSDD